jgi:hypothetical protein
MQPILTPYEKPWFWSPEWCSTYNFVRKVMIGAQSDATHMTVQRKLMILEPRVVQRNQYQVFTILELRMMQPIYIYIYSVGQARILEPRVVQPI